VRAGRRPAALAAIATAACSSTPKNKADPEPDDPAPDPVALADAAVARTDAAPKSVWDTAALPPPTGDHVMVASTAPLFALRPEMPPPVESASAYRRFRVVKADPRWVTVETGDDGVATHCEPTRGDLADLALHVHVPRSALGTVVVSPIVVDRGGGTRIELEPGVLVTATESADTYTVAIAGVPATIAIDTRALGDIYQPAPKPAPAGNLGFEPKMPRTALSFGDGKKFALDGGGELGCIAAPRVGDRDGGLVTVASRCARVRVRVASKWIAKTPCSIGGVLGSSGRNQVTVRKDAPAWWPDTRRAGRTLDDAPFDAVGYQRDGKTCLVRTIAKPPKDVDSLGGSLVLCFDPADVR
jgi:hypothetical protein